MLRCPTDNGDKFRLRYDVPEAPANRGPVSRIFKIVRIIPELSYHAMDVGGEIRMITMVRHQGHHRSLEINKGPIDVVGQTVERLKNEVRSRCRRRCRLQQ